MANHKPMQIINSIHTLKESGKSYREIARILKIDRKTVKRVLEKGPNPTPGSNPYEAALGQMGPNPTSGSEQDPPFDPLSEIRTRIPHEGPSSKALPLLGIIVEKLEGGMHGKSIHLDLEREHGFTGSYQSVKRLIRHIRKARPQWVPRLEYPLGEAAQVDFGEVRILKGSGRHKRKAYLFVMTLCSSRKMYVEAVADQSQETFVACHMRAFAFFGGVPEAIIPDNLKAAVIKACWEDPVLNRVYVHFAGHYGCAILPCRVRRPEEKGIVESGVKYVKGYLKGRCFVDLAELNAWLEQWEKNVAGTRIHGTTKRQVNEAFEEERAHLQPLPDEPFDIFRVESRVVHPDGYIQIGARFYEVPPAYLGRTVIVHVHASVLRVYDGDRQIVMHARGGGRGARVRGNWTQPREVPRAQSELEAWVRRDAEKVGAEMLAYVAAAIETKGRIAYRMLQGVLGLENRYGRGMLNAVAAELTMERNFDGKAFRRQCAELQPPTELLQEHDIVRELSEYSLESLLSTQPNLWSQNEY